MRTTDTISQRSDRPTPASLRHTVDRGDLGVVFQPVLRLSDHQHVGFEALARFDGEAGPEAWFEAAADHGLRLRLETMAAAKAVAEARHLPDGAFVAINASVAALESLPFLEALLPGPLDRLVIEVSEAELDAPALDEVVAALRMLGIRLAVDDVGVGPASLVRLAELAPEFIKVDRSVTRRLRDDPSARAVVAGLVALADRLGSTVLAEGIEEAPELGTLVDLGVVLGQGFALGVPAAVA